LKAKFLIFHLQKKIKAKASEKNKMNYFFCCLI